jgi:hypothetical protein
MLDTLQAADFTPLLHQNVIILFEADKPVEAEVMEVREMPAAYTPIDRVPFSLVVRTPQQTHYYQQMTAVLEHPEKGQLPVFFVPIGFDGTGMLYEAVFS